MEKGRAMTRRLIRGLAAMIIIAAVAPRAGAEIVTFRPRDGDIGDLDHHFAYAWRISTGLNLTGLMITDARIRIENIENWDTSANRLFIHLLDTAKYSGVSKYRDAPLYEIPVGRISDEFAESHTGDSKWLLAPGTADTLLTSRSFSDRPIDYTYVFNASQLTALDSYIRNDGKIALGFDADCHYFNDGVKLTITTSPTSVTAVPEGSTLISGSIVGLAGLGYGWRRRKAATV
jgi:hypothetical protein